MEKKADLTVFERNTKERIMRLINEFCDGSQQMFADKVGINKASVSQYVKGRNTPGNKTAKKIAVTFGVNPAWVHGFSDDMYEKEAVKKVALVSDDAVRKERLLAGYEKLNDLGRDEAIRRVEEMALVSRFTEVQILGLPTRYDESMPVAAHHSPAADGHEAEALAEANKIMRDDEQN